MMINRVLSFHKPVSKDSTEEVRRVTMELRSPFKGVKSFKANLDLEQLKGTQTLTVPNSETSLPESMGDVIMFFAHGNRRRVLTGRNFTARCNFDGMQARWAKSC